MNALHDLGLLTLSDVADSALFQGACLQSGIRTRPRLSSNTGRFSRTPKARATGDAPFLERKETDASRRCATACRLLPSVHIGRASRARKRSPISGGILTPASGQRSWDYDRKCPTLNG